MNIPLHLNLRTVSEGAPPEDTRLLVLVQSLSRPEQFFTVVAVYANGTFCNAQNMVPIRQVIAYVELPLLERVLEQSELEYLLWEAVPV